jgi:hypothetical protein
MDRQYLVVFSQGGLTSGRRPVVKIIAQSLSQRDEKHVVPTPLSGKKKKYVFNTSSFSSVFN